MNNSTYEIEFDITNLLRELLRGAAGTGRRTDATAGTATTTGTNATSNHTTTGTTATNTGATSGATTTTPETTATNATSNATIGTNATTGAATSTTSAYLAMMQHNQTIMDELVYSYNAQMQRYNTNVERLIQMLQTNQTRIHQYMMLPHSNLSQTNEPTFHIPVHSPFRRNAIREDGNTIRSLLNMNMNNTNTPSNISWLYTYLYPRGTQERSRNTVSAEQRETAIQNISYDSTSMQENVCPISLLPFTQGEQISQIRHCRHIFKTDSLDNWLSHYSTCCPVCRYDIRNYQDSSNANASASSPTQQSQDSFDYDSDETDEE